MHAQKLIKLALTLSLALATSCQGSAVLRTPQPPPLTVSTAADLVYADTSLPVQAGQSVQLSLRRDAVVVLPSLSGVSH